ncbi:MAG: VanW family protein [Eubacteriales bacterium]|nr:VanW family protein [Eubacteriales bacterium]
MSTRYPERGRATTGSARGAYSRGTPSRGGRGAPPSHRKPQPARRSPGGLLIVVVVLIAAVCGGGLWLAMSQRSDDVERVTRGVSISGVDVSGMSYEKVLETLRPTADAAIAATTVTFTYQDKTWQYSAQQLGVSDNLTELAYHALDLAVTQEGTRDKEEAARIRENGEEMQIAYHYDEQKLITIFEEISTSLGLPAEDATITFDPNAGDTPEEMFTITAGRDGEVLHKEQALADFSGVFQAGQSFSLALPIEYVESAYSVDFLKQCTTPLIHLKNDKDKWEVQPFRTKVGGTADRKKNVELALSKFNGMVVQPGQTVSFNETTGERSAANGYLQAPGIAGDYTSELTYGGGVCQASTTIYNAMLMANCRVDERKKHSIPSKYVKKGFDAMVNWPGTDMKFTNTGNGPLFIKAWYDGTYANVQVYGQPLPDDVVIERVSTIVEKVDPPVEVETRVDKTGEFVVYSDEEYIYRDASAGVKAQASLVYWNSKTGEKVDEKILYTDYYKAFGKIVYVGKEKRPTPSVTPKPTTTPDDGDEGSDSEAGAPTATKK